MPVKTITITIIIMLLLVLLLDVIILITVACSVLFQALPAMWKLWMMQIKIEISETEFTYSVSAFMKPGYLSYLCCLE